MLQRACDSVDASSAGTRCRGIGRFTVVVAASSMPQESSMGTLCEPAIQRHLTWTVEERNQQQRTPEDVILYAGIAQVGIRHDRHNVEHEQRKRREARSESH